MQENRSLYDFLVQRAPEMAEQWVKAMKDNDPKSIYSSKEPAVINRFKETHSEYTRIISRIFVETKVEFFDTFRKWIRMIAQDRANSGTPIQNVLRQFMNARGIHWAAIMEYVDLHRKEVDQEQVRLWEEVTIQIFDETMCIFSEEYYNFTTGRLKAQQEMINELSAPIIVISKEKALLPLVGDIDTARAKMILENTLKECAAKGVAYLYIDLSGVVMIDTMVAQQIFQLLDTLKLLGIKSILSGIRPEIAQTAIQLGISFKGIEVTSNLAQALAVEVEKIRS